MPTIDEYRGEDALWKLLPEGLGNLISEIFEERDDNRNEGFMCFLYKEPEHSVFFSSIYWVHSVQPKEMLIFDVINVSCRRNDSEKDSLPWF